MKINEEGIFTSSVTKIRAVNFVKKPLFWKIVCLMRKAFVNTYVVFEKGLTCIPSSFKFEIKNAVSCQSSYMMEKLRAWNRGASQLFQGFLQLKELNKTNNSNYNTIEAIRELQGYYGKPHPLGKIF